MILSTNSDLTIKVKFSVLLKPSFLVSLFFPILISVDSYCTYDCHWILYMRYHFYHSISFFVCFYLNVPFSDLDIVIVIRRITLTCAPINSFVKFLVAPTKYGYLFLKQMFSDAKKVNLIVSYLQLIQL